MQINGRGTHALVGETIDWIDTTAINVIHIHCKSGEVISIDGEQHHFGIPTISVNDWTETLEATH